MKQATLESWLGNLAAGHTNLAGEQIDIDSYFRKYSPMVLRRCKSILGDDDAAYDALQEVFMKLLKKQSSLKHQHPSSLLYRIATNTCLNMIRDNKRLVKDDGLAEKIAAVEKVEDQVLARDLIDRIFKRQESTNRLIAVMRFIDQMTLQQIADELKLSVSGVRKRLQKIATLAEEFKKEIDE